MKLGFYMKLALNNIAKNKKNYFPYILSNILVICIFFSFSTLLHHIPLYTTVGLTSIPVVLGFGSYILGIFALVFMFYTNSFLFKRRKKELGLYNVLGMEKRHLHVMIGLEVLDVALISIAVGLACGLLFFKFSELLLFKILQQTAPSGFHFSIAAVRETVTLFGGIFILTFIYDMFAIRKVNAIDLLAQAKSGEQEPKARWLLVILGILSLGAGYFLAMNAQLGPEVLLIFFLAVLLVIIGTYCLFISGSIALLKLLKKKKSYYYQAHHFLNISQMIYRMKQNAVGLANICILSTMVIVTLSTTISLYAGTGDFINTIYPTDARIMITYQMVPMGNEVYDTSAIINFNEVDQIIHDAADEADMPLENISMYHQYQSPIRVQGQNITTGSYPSADEEEQTAYFVSAETLPDLPQLNDGEILLYQGGRDILDIWKPIVIDNREYRIADELSNEQLSMMGYEMQASTLIIIVKDESALQEMVRPETSEAAFSQYIYQFDTNKENHERFFNDIYVALFGADGEVGIYSGMMENKWENYDQMLQFYGGLFFIGLFLGGAFMIATILIIYYKQISEGYEDAYRFEVMQKVGMSQKEVKQTIRSQILSVFFLPLLVACCHMVFAFRLIQIILAMLALNNTQLFVIACSGVVLVFTLFYCIVYILTSKAYYQIVSRT